MVSNSTTTDFIVPFQSYDYQIGNQEIFNLYIDDIVTVNIQASTTIYPLSGWSGSGYDVREQKILISASSQSLGSLTTFTVYSVPVISYTTSSAIGTSYVPSTTS